MKANKYKLSVIKQIEKKKLLLISSLFIILLSFLFFILIFAFTKNFENLISSKNNFKINYYNDQISTIINYNQIIAETYFENTILENETILDIINKANFSNEAEKTILRNTLYEIIIPIYQDTTTNHFRQFHFHLKNNESFLRMHKPEKYGDNLELFRATVRTTNQNMLFTKGFEEGKIFNGYRYVFPLFFLDEHIGSVELSVSIASITQTINELFNNPSIFIT